MTDEMLDALARQVLLDASGLGCSDAKETQEQHTFSPSFERKMKKLIRRADHPVRYRVTQAVACAALVIFLGGGSVLAFSAEARAAVFGWVREVYETYFVYRYEGAETTIPEETIFIPTWLPEGYEIEVEPKPGGMVTSTYRNDAEQRIILICSYNTESSLTHIVPDGAEALQTFVNGIPADFYYDAEEGASSILVWHDEEIGAMFQISAALPQEDMIKIAESITAVVYEQPSPKNTLLRPTWIPEGYEMVVEPRPGDMVRIVYQSKNAYLSFSYTKNVENASIYVEREGADIQRVYVGDIPADLLIDQDGGANVIVWKDDKTGFIFWISAHLPSEDMIKMAESVEAHDIEPLTLENAIYTPTWVPDGYEIIGKPDTESMHLMEWSYQNADGLMIMFIYTADPQAVNVFVEQDGVDVQSVSVGNHQADLYLDNREGQPSSIVWTDEKNDILFLISAYLSGEDLIKMAESIELTKME